MKTIDAAIVGVSLPAPPLRPDCGSAPLTTTPRPPRPATCRPGKTIAIEQLKDGVYCNYARAYGRDIKRRKAG